VPAAASRSGQGQDSPTGFLPPLSDIRKIRLGCYVKSSLIGYVRRATLPGAGGSMGVFLRHTETSATSSDPRTFGARATQAGIARVRKRPTMRSAAGAIGGRCSPSRIPGDPITAIMLGVLGSTASSPGHS